jgi:hypothetical protein
LIHLRNEKDQNTDNLLTIDVNNVTLTYTQDPTINPMTDEDLQGFQRDELSANG